jgi:AraC family transcriptional regulator
MLIENHLPVLTTHVYWEKKKHFQLDMDTYEEWVLFAVEEGSFHYRIGEIEGLAVSGDIVLCPPMHRFERETMSPLTFHFIRFTLNGDPGVPIGHIKLSRRTRMMDNMNELKYHVHSRSEISMLLRSHILQDIWLMILTDGMKESKEESAQVTSTDPTIESVKQYLTVHACLPLQLKKVANTFHISPVQLTRRFQHAYKMNPLVYITELRLQQACELLTESDETIDAIALRCGYENGFYLSRVFKKRLGLTPSDYRKSYRV